VSHDAEEALAATNTPALVIGGELDRITPVAFSRRMAELLPDAELHVLDDAGHQLMLERPDEVADLLDRFAKRLETHD
jgi:pimeloyl-ACP methyl ester carboxylesterase